MPSGERKNPLNYIYAYIKEKTENGKVRHGLSVCGYHVGGIVRKMASSKNTLGLSATIGDPDILSMDCGLKFGDRSCVLTNSFSAKNAKIFMPTDTPNLSVNVRSNRDLPQILRKIDPERIIFFGSAAAKNVTDKSDIDLAVEITGNEELKIIHVLMLEKFGYRKNVHVNLFRIRIINLAESFRIFIFGFE